MAEVFRKRPWDEPPSPDGKAFIAELLPFATLPVPPAIEVALRVLEMSVGTMGPLREAAERALTLYLTTEGYPAPTPK